MTRKVLAKVAFIAIGLALAVAWNGCRTGGERNSRTFPPTTPGTPTAHPATAGEELASVPSGSLLFRTAEGYSSDIFLVNADGSGLTALTDSTENDTPGAFSPDGKLISYNVYLRDDRADGVYVMSPDGKDPRRVTEGALWDWFVSWSAKGKMLFAMGTVGPAEFWVANADGSDPVKVLSLEDSGEADWSPDGENLVVTKCDLWAGIPDPPCSLLILDEYGNLVRALLKGGPRSLRSPKWSPDGENILFVSQPNDRPAALMIIGADGGDERTLYQLPPGTNWDREQWSPDSSQVAVAMEEQIAVVSMADGAAKTIASGERIDYSAWSPDGSKIAYVSGQNDWELFVVDSRGGEPSRIADQAYPSQVSWSPDGKRILFASTRNRQRGVYWVSPDGSERHRLDLLSDAWRAPATPTVDATGGCRKGATENSCLSPDGKSEAVVYPNGKSVVIRDLATGATRDIPVEGSTPGNPVVWSPDGEKLALYASTPELRSLYVADVASGETTQLDADFAGGRALLWSADASWIYYEKGVICGEGCAPGFLYRIRVDGSGEERVVDMRIDTVYGFKP